MTLKIGGLEIGGDNPCRFVAEMSNNHNGDRDRLGRMIDAAHAAGADVIKVQAYTPDELCELRGNGPAPAQWGEQGWSMRELYAKAQTPLEWLPRIAAHCERVGVPWFSSVFGLDSLAALEAVGCSAYKIARLDNMHTRLIDAVKRTGKPVIVSGAREDVTAGDGVSWLYCPPGYPAPIENVRLPQPFATEGFVGISSHCLEPMLPVAAVARGAKLIEMHFQLAEEPSELEANISLNEHQWRVMVENCRRVEAMLA